MLASKVNGSIITAKIKLHKLSQKKQGWNPIGKQQTLMYIPAPKMWLAVNLWLPGDMSGCQECQ